MIGVRGGVQLQGARAGLGSARIPDTAWAMRMQDSCGEGAHGVLGRRYLEDSDAGPVRFPPAAGGAENRSRSPPVLHVPSIDRLPKRKRAETPSFPIDERFTRCELHDLARLRLGGGRLFLDLLYGFH